MAVDGEDWGRGLGEVDAVTEESPEQERPDVGAEGIANQWAEEAREASEDEPEEMAEWERLAHFVFGVMQGTLPQTDRNLGAAWAEYQRLGGDPDADPWPVTSLGGVELAGAVLDKARELHEEILRHVEEHGPSADLLRTDKQLAALLGVQPVQAPVKATPVADAPDALVEDALSDLPEGEFCTRCFMMDNVEAPLTEKDGRPWCVRCETDGSGKGL